MLESMLDTPIMMRDTSTGEMVPVPLGDVVANNATPVADAIGGVLGSVNPVLGLMTAGVVGTIFAGARRKKKRSGQQVT